MEFGLKDHAKKKIIKNLNVKLNLNRDSLPIIMQRAPRYIFVFYLNKLLQQF